MLISIYRSPAQGFSLVELIITMAVAAVLLTISTISFAGWIANAKVRTVAEVLQNALRLAQTEALKRSRQTAFLLTAGAPTLGATPSATGTNWVVQVLPIVSAEPPAYVQGGNLREQSSGVIITATAAQICFNSAGRLVTNLQTGTGTDCMAPASDLLYTISKAGADRDLKIKLSPAGKIRMCDAAKILSVANPDGC